ncbi:hypothetical protein RI367_004212 [Sorochytrium milnesiophthora]
MEAATPQTVAERIATATQKKDEGNVLFQEERYPDALRKYHEANMYIHQLVRPPAADDDDKDAPSDLTASASSTGTKPKTAARSSGSSIASMLDKQTQPTTQESEQITKLYISVYSNMAACHIKNQKWARAIEYCDKALQFDKKNAKALFRKGSSWMHLGYIDKAEAVLLEAQKVAPNDPAINNELQIAKRRQREAYEKQKRQFAGMFDRASGSGSKKAA